MDSLEGAIVSAVNSTIPTLLTPAEVDPETCQCVAAPFPAQKRGQLTNSCDGDRLLGPVALGVQAIMGALVIGSLLLKRSREKPRRKWRVWLGSAHFSVQSGAEVRTDGASGNRDISKQIVGQAFVHASNVAISGALHFRRLARLS